MDGSKKIFEEFSATLSKLSNVVSANKKSHQNWLYERKKYFEDLLQARKEHRKNLSIESRQFYAQLKNENEKHHQDIASERDRFHTESCKANEKLHNDISLQNQDRETKIKIEEERIAREEKQRRQLDRTILIAICSIVVLYCFHLVLKWESEKKQVATISVQLHKNIHERNIIQHQISKEFAGRDTLINAMVEVRTIRDEGQRQCRDGKYIGLYPFTYKRKLLAADNKLEEATLITDGVFYNLDIHNKTISFTDLVSVNKPAGFCSKNAVTDQKLMLLQTEINTLIVNEINMLENKLNNAVSGNNKK